MKFISHLFFFPFHKAPISLEDGGYLSHEEVVAQLSADTLSSSSTLGRDGRSFAAGTYAQAVVLNLKSEVILCMLWFVVAKNLTSSMCR